MRPELLATTSFVVELTAVLAAYATPPVAVATRATAAMVRCLADWVGRMACPLFEGDGARVGAALAGREDRRPLLIRRPKSAGDTCLPGGRCGLVSQPRT